MRRRRPDLTPDLLSPRRSVGVGLAVAVLGAIAVYALLAWLLKLPVHPMKLADRKLAVEVFKAALTLAAGLGAVVALVINYRRHRIDESQSHRDDQRLFTDRFQSASEQLGHERPAVRLAGVHAMAHLADDWDQQRQTCIDVLCAYLRLPANLTGTNQQTDIQSASEKLSTPPEEREIRQTIVRLITDHLRIDPADTTQTSWQGSNLDFTNAIFDGTFSFDGARFSGGLVNFGRATFSGGLVSFIVATFSGGQVDFDRATFSDGHVGFIVTTFSGGLVNFDGATFSGGLVNFSEPTFSGGQVSFIGATFSGGQVSFRRPVQWDPVPFAPPDPLPEGLLLPDELTDAQ